MRSISVAALLFLLFAGLASSPAIAVDQPTYLLLYAFDAEGVAIGNAMTVAHTDTILGRTVQSGTVSGQSIILAESGVGMTNAAMTTQRLIDQFHPLAVIFTGIAGAVDSAVHIGDIVVAAAWIQHDFGVVDSGGFRRSGVRTFCPAQDSIVRLAEFPVDSSLLGTAQEAINNGIALDSIADRIPKVSVGGIGASGNTFIDNTEKRQWLSNSLHAKVVDMESAAVVQVCIANKIPVIVLRSASDLAGGSGSSTARTEMDRFFSVAAGNSASVVLRLLERLQNPAGLQH